MQNNRFCFQNLEPKFTKRPIIKSDEALLWKHLTFLPTLYPNAFHWLEDEVNNACKKSRYSNLYFNKMGDFCGLLISKIKSHERVKICTLYIPKNKRNQHAGSFIINDAIQSYEKKNINNFSITFSNEQCPTMGSFLKHNGFKYCDYFYQKNRQYDRELVYDLKI